MMVIHQIKLRLLLVSASISNLSFLTALPACSHSTLLPFSSPSLSPFPLLFFALLSIPTPTLFFPIFLSETSLTKWLAHACRKHLGSVCKRLGLWVCTAVKDCLEGSQRLNVSPRCPRWWLLDIYRRLSGVASFFLLCVNVCGKDLGELFVSRGEISTDRSM